MELSNRPGGRIIRRLLHFFFLLDRSNSMGERGKIQSLNTAIRETIPAMRDVALEHPEADILVRSLSFGQDVRWDVATPTRIEDFTWADLIAWGGTPMGAAMSELANALSRLFNNGSATYRFRTSPNSPVIKDSTFGSSSIAPTPTPPRASSVRRLPRTTSFFRNRTSSPRKVMAV